jgi:nucleotide-binding universal stress UspA family protein
LISDAAAARAAAEPLEAIPHMSEVVSDLRARGVSRAGSLVLHSDDAGEALVEASTALNVDVVVVTSHGLGGVRRAVLGSVAGHLVQHARDTVVLLCPAEPQTVESGMRRVLLPLDGSDLSELAVPHAEHIARASGAELVLLQVIDDEDADEQRESARADLETLASSLREREAAQVNIEVSTGDPSEAILAAVERLGADLIVMATHGRGGLGRLLLGSIADTVSRESVHAPVLLVRPPAD